VANVGNFGSATRIDYTAIGENINLASRLEGLNKQVRTGILISGATREGLGDRFVVRSLGRFRLKGFVKTVEVFELIGRPDGAERTRPWRDAFADALDQFQRRDFAGAKAGFERVLASKPDDGPSRFYLSQIAEFGGQHPPDDWAGEIELQEK